VPHIRSHRTRLGDRAGRAPSFYQPFCEVLEVRSLPAVTFQPLGDLPGGGFDSHAHDLSEDGTTVVGFGTSASGREAFRWAAGVGLVGLGDLSGGRFNSVAFGVSADGSVVAGYGYPTDFSEAFAWTTAGGLNGLGFRPGQEVSGAYGISADGKVIVGQAPLRPFRWTATAGMTDLGDLPGGDAFGSANAASADGSVVVGYSTSGSGLEAFRWTQAGGMVGLGSLSTTNFNSGALDVSADGSVVTGWSRSASGWEAFRWTAEGGMVGLGDLPGGDYYSEADAMTPDGSVIVGVASINPGTEVDQWRGKAAFIWDSDHGMRPLREVLIGLGVDLAGWRLIEATGISGDGRTIVGAGINPAGQREAWIAHLATGVTINQAVGQTDPTRGPTVSFDVAFSRPVTGFDAADIDLSASTVGGTLVPVVSGSGSTYTVTVTGMTGSGTVIARIPAAAAIDDTGEATLASTSTDNQVTFDEVAPTVTIDQAAGQADPTSGPAVAFTVHFGEPVSGFTGSAVSLAGSTVGGNLVAGVTGSGADYTVTVTGMVGDGLLEVSIPAVTITDRAGNPNLASTSTDNQVTVVSGGNLQFASAVFAATEDGGLATITVTRTDASVGTVMVDYATTDGSAHAGSDYTAAAGTLSWADGETGGKTFTIPIANDTLNEGTELIHLTLTNPTGNAALGLAAAQVAIERSDPLTGAPITFFDQDGDKVIVRATGTRSSNSSGPTRTATARGRSS
jgi:probable HAF family extracellular repeat protein